MRSSALPPAGMLIAAGIGCDACSSRGADGTCVNATNTYQAGQKFYLYTPQLDHLSNDAENFGGMMTEVNICTTVNPITKVGTGCPST